MDRGQGGEEGQETLRTLSNRVSEFLIGGVTFRYSFFFWVVFIESEVREGGGGA